VKLFPIETHSLVCKGKKANINIHFVPTRAHHIFYSLVTYLPLLPTFCLRTQKLLTCEIPLLSKFYAGYNFSQNSHTYKYSEKLTHVLNKVKLLCHMYY